MTLPRLVQEFAAPGCFTLDEATAATGKARAAIKKEIEYLQARGYLESVRRGLYVLDPGKSFGPDPDRFVVASKVAPSRRQNGSNLSRGASTDSAPCRPQNGSWARVAAR